MGENKNNSQKSSQKGVWLIFSIICLIACVVCVVFVVRYMQDRKSEEDAYKQLRDKVVETQSPDAPVMDQPAAPTVDIPIDFAALQEQNPDVYAWIQVPGTLVDYPVVQHPTDDFFYLDHDLNQEHSVAGTIYSESLNTKDFTDPNTVLYGHNMKNDTMFGSLHSYEDRAFFDANRTVIVYMPTQKLTYQIFAAYRSGAEHLLNTYNTKDPAGFAAYLEQVRENRSMSAFIDKEVIVNENSQILTLSTCIGNDANSRYLVQAVLVSREQ